MKDANPETTHWMVSCMWYSGEGNHPPVREEKTIVGGWGGWRVGYKKAAQGNSFVFIFAFRDETLYLDWGSRHRFYVLVKPSTQYIPNKQTNKVHCELKIVTALKNKKILK